MSEVKVDKISPKTGTSMTVGDSGDTFTVPSGATLTVAGALNVTGTTSLADGTVAVAELDIDGATDIGEAIVDADLFVVDNGAGGTNRKTAASRLKTYVTGANSVDSDQYVDGSIDLAHMSVNSIDSDQYVDGSIDTAHIGALQVTGAKLNTDVISAQTALAAAPADTDEFMVSDAGVLKRIDYSLIKAANTPSFFAYLSADQSLSSGVATKIQINTEIYDTDSNYDNSSNYRFTPTTAGKYLIFGSVNLFQDDSSDLKIAMILFYKNGSLLYETHDNFSSNYLRGVSQSMSVVMDMNGSSDYVEMYGKIEINSGATNLRAENGDRRCVFGAYKLIGV